MLGLIPLKVARFLLLCGLVAYSLYPQNAKGLVPRSMYVDSPNTIWLDTN